MTDQKSVFDHDSADDYAALLEKLRQLGRSAQANETNRRLARRAFVAIHRLLDERRLVPLPEPPEDPALGIDTECCQ